MSFLEITAADLARGGPVEALTEIARASPDYNTFFERVQQSNLVDLSSQDFRFGRAFAMSPDDQLETVADIAQNPQYIASMPFAVRAAVTSKSPKVWIYRAVPTAHAREGIRVGDYVALDRAYATLHGRSVLRGEQKESYRVIKARVPKQDVIWGGADWEEWTYSPQSYREQVGSLSEFYTKVTGRPAKWTAPPSENDSGEETRLRAQWQAELDALPVGTTLERDYHFAPWTKEPDGRWSSPRLPAPRYEPWDSEELARRRWYMHKDQQRTAAYYKEELPLKRVRELWAEGHKPWGWDERTWTVPLAEAASWARLDRSPGSHKHDDASWAALTDELRSGWDPSKPLRVIVHPDGIRVADGNHRVQMALDAGLTDLDVPVVIASMDRYPMPKTAAPVERRERIEYDDICPHCHDKIREKSVYVVAGQVYHKPCGGEIEFAKSAQMLVDEAIDQIARSDGALRLQLEEAARSLAGQGLDEDEIIDRLWQERQKRKFVRTLQPQPDKSVAGAALDLTGADAEIAGETPDYWIVAIGDWEAARRLGTRAWCIVRDPSAWAGYAEEGVRFFFYVSKKTGAAMFALAVTDEGLTELYDAKDKLIPCLLSKEELAPARSRLSEASQAQFDLWEEQKLWTAREATVDELRAAFESPPADFDPRIVLPAALTRHDFETEVWPQLSGEALRPLWPILRAIQHQIPAAARLLEAEGEEHFGTISDVSIDGTPDFETTSFGGGRTSIDGGYVPVTVSFSSGIKVETGAWIYIDRDDDLILRAFAAHEMGNMLDPRGHLPDNDDEAWPAFIEQIQDASTSDAVYVEVQEALTAFVATEPGLQEKLSTWCLPETADEIRLAWGDGVVDMTDDEIVTAALLVDNANFDQFPLVRLTKAQLGDSAWFTSEDDKVTGTFASEQAAALAAETRVLARWKPLIAQIQALRTEEQSTVDAGAHAWITDGAPQAIAVELWQATEDMPRTRAAFDQLSALAWGLVARVDNLYRIDSLSDEVAAAIVDRWSDSDDDLTTRALRNALALGRNAEHGAPIDNGAVTSYRILDALSRAGPKMIGPEAYAKITADVTVTANVGDAAARVARRPVRDEVEVASETVRIETIPGLVEDWDLHVLTGKHYQLDLPAGRILIGDAAHPEAALSWTTAYGKPYVHNIWVADDLRRRGVARMLYDAYRRHISTHVETVGPFSEEGLATAKALSDKVRKSGVAVTAAPRKPKAPKAEVPLVAVHGLNEQRFLYAAQSGGLIAPSIAIKRADDAYTRFGKLVLVAPLSMVDPEKTPVFNADIYSPRYPRVFYKPNDKAVSQTVGQLKPFIEESGSYFSDVDHTIEREGVDGVLSSRDKKPALQMAFLRTKGIDVEKPMRAKQIKMSWVAAPSIKQFFDTHGYDVNARMESDYWRDLSEAARRAVHEHWQGEAAGTLDEENKAILIDHSISQYFGDDKLLFYSSGSELLRSYQNLGKTELDKGELRDRLEAAIQPYEAEFEQWARELLTPMQGQPYIYTEGGQKLKYTPENVLRVMTKKTRGGENWNYGAGSTRAFGAKKFRSLAEMQAHADQLVSPEQMEETKTTLNEQLLGLVERARRYHNAPDSFRVTESLQEALAESFKRGKSLWRELQSSGFNNVPRDLVEDLEAYKKTLVNAPTEYFEAKPQRIIGLDEFIGLAAPTDVSQAVLAAAQAEGLAVELYDPADPQTQVTALAKLSARGKRAFVTVTAADLEREARTMRPGTPQPGVYYHGTDADKVPSILTYGLKAGSGTEFAPAVAKDKQLATEPGVYLTSWFEQAVRYGQGLARGGDPVVLEVHLDPAQVREDLMDDPRGMRWENLKNPWKPGNPMMRGQMPITQFMYSGDIPPEAIVAVYAYDVRGERYDVPALAGETIQGYEAARRLYFALKKFLEYGPEIPGMLGDRHISRLVGEATAELEELGIHPGEYQYLDWDDVDEEEATHAEVAAMVADLHAKLFTPEGVGFAVQEEPAHIQRYTPEEYLAQSRTARFVTVTAGRENDIRDAIDFLADQWSQDWSMWGPDSVELVDSGEMDPRDLPLIDPSALPKEPDGAMGGYLDREDEAHIKAQFESGEVNPVIILQGRDFEVLADGYGRASYALRHGLPVPFETYRIETATKTAAKPTVIPESGGSMRLDPIGVTPTFPEDRERPGDLGRPVKTPDGYGRLFNYWRAWDGDTYVEIAFPDGTTRTYEKGQLDFRTLQRRREQLIEKRIERQRAKAKALGFDTSRPFFHGTSASEPFDEFNPAFQGSTDAGWFGLGYYFAPTLRGASPYSWRNGRGHIRAVYLKYSNPLVLKDDLSAIRDRIEADGVESPGQLTEWLRAHGYDAVERWHGTELSEVMVPDRTQIRDVGADFEDPESTKLTAADERPRERHEWNGMPVSIEFKGGQVRYPGGEFETYVPAEWVGYGYFDDLLAEDGDSLDVIWGPDAEGQGDVFLAAQTNPDGEFQQFKVMIGFASEAEAEAGFKLLWPPSMFAGLNRVPPDVFQESVVDNLVVDEAQADDMVDPDEPKVHVARTKRFIEVTADIQQKPRKLDYFTKIAPRRVKEYTAATEAFLPWLALSDPDAARAARDLMTDAGADSSRVEYVAKTRLAYAVDLLNDLGWLTPEAPWQQTLRLIEGSAQKMLGVFQTEPEALVFHEERYRETAPYYADQFDVEGFAKALTVWQAAARRFIPFLEDLVSKSQAARQVWSDERPPAHEDVEVLYHASVHARALAEEGFKPEVPAKGGLGGSQSTRDSQKGVSFTHDLYVALQVSKSLKEVIGIANGTYKYEDVARWIVEDGGDLAAIERDARNTFMSSRPIPSEHRPLGVPDRAEPHKTAPDTVFALYKAYLAFTKRYDPVYFNVSIDQFAGLDEADVGVVAAEVDMTDPSVTFVSGMHEWRVPPRAIKRIVKFIGDRPGKAAFIEVTAADACTEAADGAHVCDNQGRCHWCGQLMDLELWEEYAGPQGPALRLRSVGYQQYEGEYEGRRVQIKAVDRVEHGTYPGNRRQRRRREWVIKIDGQEVGSAATLNAARTLARRHVLGDTIEVTADTRRVAYMRADLQPGEKGGVFLRLPDELAAQFPEWGRAGKDESPPHFTLLYLGSIPDDRKEDLWDMVEDVAAEFGPFEVELTPGVEWFQNDEGQWIAHKGVTPKTLKQLAELHAQLKAGALALGLDVKHKDPFIAHATLAYLDEQVWPEDVEVPEGSFEADAIEVWGWPNDVTASLTKLQKAAQSWCVRVAARGSPRGKRPRRRVEKRRRIYRPTWYRQSGSNVAWNGAFAPLDAVEIVLRPGAKILNLSEASLRKSAALDDDTRAMVETLKSQAEAIKLLSVTIDKLLAANRGGYDAVQTEDRLIVLNPEAVEEQPKRKRWLG